MSGPLHLRIFISSPGDVQDERNLARRLIKDELPYDPFLRRKVLLEVVSWDDPAAGVPMLATMSPQDAVNRGLGRPSECDIVVVVLWSRIGTQLPDSFRKPNGEPFRSGTEWEFEDARTSQRELLVYRRTEKVLLDDEAPDFEENRRQKRLVREFFAAFVNSDGSCTASATNYATPGEFKERLARDLKALIAPRLSALTMASIPEPVWEGSPYPGLRAFAEAETAIFFGRTRETDELLARLRDPDCRFLAIVGDSGTGKSSLLHAGLLPRLRAGALPSSEHWRFASFTPAAQMGDPFLAVATALRDALPPAMRPAPRVRARALADDAEVLQRTLDKVLTGAPDAAEFVLAIDQFEELFALARHGPFIELLGRAAATARVRILATMRADFLPQALRHDTLVGLLRAGSFPVGAPSTLALIDMVRRPAERAGARLPDDLVDALLTDAGNQPGALPLVAFALSELWPEDAGKSDPSLAAYEGIGRLGGAIGRRAAALDLDPARLNRLFPDLIQISPEGIATRRPLDRSRLADADLPELIDALVEERFLRPGSDPSLPTVELSHEILLTAWPALAVWLGERGPHLRTRRELDDALARWTTSGRNEQELIPPGSRLIEAEELLHAAPDLVADPALRAFINASLARAAHVDCEAQEALRREARRLTQLTVEQTRAGDAVTAMLLGLEALERVGLVRDDVPLVPAVAALHEAIAIQQEALNLRSHEGPVHAAVFSPDGTSVLTGSDDGTARIWDAACGQELLVLRGHEGPVQAAVFSPDGTNVLTGSDDGTAIVWDAASGQELLILRDHEGPVHAAVYSSDGTSVLAGSDNGTAIVWDAASGQELLVLRRHERWVHSAVFSPDGTSVLAGSGDGTARIWDAASGQELLVLRGHERGVHSAVFSPDGMNVLTGSDDGTARVWDAVSGQQLLVLRLETFVRSAVFSPGGTSVLTVSLFDGTARLWNIASGADQRILRGHEGPVGSAVFSPDGARILTASSDGTARLWDAAPAHELRILRGHEDSVLSAVFSPDGARILTASLDGTARLWDTASVQELCAIRGHERPVFSAAFSPDGARVLTASFDGTARLWDAVSGQELLVLRGHKHLVYSIAFLSDGTSVLTASGDGTARVWDAVSGQEQRVFRGHEGPVRSAAFSPDGARVLTASFDGTARLWDAVSGQELLVLRGHDDRVISAVFSPDGARILTASTDNTARLWDAACGQELRVLRGHENWVSSAVFSPDGARILTASFDKTARLWAEFASIDALITAVRARLPRQLSAAQRQRFYLP